MMQSELTINDTKISFCSSVKIKYLNSGSKYLLSVQKNLLQEIHFTFFRTYNAFGTTRVYGSYWFLACEKISKNLTNGK